MTGTPGAWSPRIAAAGCAPDLASHRTVPGAGADGVRGRPPPANAAATPTPPTSDAASTPPAASARRRDRRRLRSLPGTTGEACPEGGPYHPGAGAAIP